ncbi:MAG: hypothetical protein ACF8PN_13030 [Phycisphaerales bacterium]
MSTSLAAKFVALILTAGSTACGLLVIRQGRIDAAHDMARLHNRILDHEQALWAIRLQVHESVRSDRVVELVRRFEAESGVPMVPFRLEACLAACAPDNGKLVVPPDAGSTRQPPALASASE